MVGRLNPTTGVTTEFPIPEGAAEIVKGPDGNLWFDFRSRHALGRVTPAGAVTVFDNLENVGNNSYRGLTSGPDGNLWMSEESGGVPGGYLVVVSPAGQTVATFADPDAPYLLTRGQDGNIWYTEFGLYGYSADGGDRIGRITPQGVITKYQIPTANPHDVGITTGPDGSIWFAELGANRIGRVGEDQAPIARAGGPYSVADGGSLSLNAFGSFDPDHDPLTYTWTINGHAGAATGVSPNVSWATFTGLGLVLGNTYSVSVTVDDGQGHTVTSSPTSLTVVAATPLPGVIEFPLPTPNSGPNAIVAGPDGNVWFMETNRNTLGRITPAGQITEVPLPVASDNASIVFASDGNIWYNTRTDIVEITPQGVLLHDYAIPSASPGNSIGGVSVKLIDSDGSIWYTEAYVSDVIGRITPAGQITEFHSGLNEGAAQLIRGPDGNFWFQATGF